MADRVRHVRKFSADAHGDVVGPLSLLYVDGAHRFGPARADLAGLGRARGAGRDDARPRRVLVDRRHLGAVRRCARRASGATSAGPASLAEYTRAPSGRWRELAAHLRELPWFARNVAIKVLVVAGRRSWAERLGLGAGRPMALLSASTNSATPATATQWTAIRSIAYSGL